MQNDTDAEPEFQPNFQPWALNLTGPNADIYELAEALGFDEVTDALAVSVFEENPTAAGLNPDSTMQALYSTQETAKAALQNLTLANDITHSIRQLPATDWVSLSQQGLPPVAAGRFWVYGSHDADLLPSDITHTIQIDAGLAFGTGHHGTTKGCLLIFDSLLESGFSPSRVLDLGSGAGTLAIAAAMALSPDTDILATDIDIDSVEVTQTNAAINDVETRITTALANGFDAPIFEGREFELIFANILAGPLMELAPDIAARLAPNGRIILSGIIDDMASNVTKAFKAQGLFITPQPSIEGWTSLLAQKDAS